MAHFAELNESNIVTRVLVVSNDELLDSGAESEAKGIDFLESLYGHRNWRQTSYNATLRHNYAGVGYSYDAERDGFVPPQPYPSWSLDEQCRWVPPVPRPEGLYRWDESTLSWVVVG